jgi:hypothetical protein
VEDAIAVSLEHLGVGIETRVPTLGDSFGEEFHSVGGIAKDDGLIDL